MTLGLWARENSKNLTRSNLNLRRLMPIPKTKLGQRLSFEQRWGSLEDRRSIGLSACQGLAKPLTHRSGTSTMLGFRFECPHVHENTFVWCEKGFEQSLDGLMDYPRDLCSEMTRGNLICESCARSSGIRFRIGKGRRPVVLWTVHLWRFNWNTVTTCRRRSRLSLARDCVESGQFWC